MTSPPGPPSYPPPYGPPSAPPPYGGGPARTSSSATLVTALLAALFVVATAVAAVAVHNHDSSSTAAAAPGASAGALQSAGDGGIPAGAGASYTGPSYNGPSYTGPSYSAVPTPTLPTPTPSTSSYVPPPAPSPTRQPLNTQLIDRTFQVYMNGLINRSLSTVKSVTCPKLRKKTKGTALDRKYISRWKGGYYTVYSSLDYVIYPVTVRYVNPNTGGDGATARYRFYVDRYPDGHYWVCGFL